MSTKHEQIQTIYQDILVCSENNFVFFHDKMYEKTKLFSKQLNLDLLELFIVYSQHIYCCSIVRLCILIGLYFLLITR